MHTNVFARNCQLSSDSPVAAAFCKAFYLKSAELADIYDRPPLLSESAASKLLKRYPDYSNA